MSEIQVSAWRVDIIESESGWGSKIDETKYFDSEQAAKDFVESYNAKDDEPITPDWYMYADYRGTGCLYLNHQYQQQFAN